VKKRILYICAPNSIHDIKWMSYFSVQQDKYEVFAIYENSIKLSNEDKEMLDKLGIKLLEPIHPFSVSSPIKTFTSIFHLRKVIKVNGIDLVHILFATPHALWGNFIDTPFIITSRGSDVLMTLPKLKQEKGLKGIYFKALYKLFERAFKKAKVVTATSQKQSTMIKQLFNVANPITIRTGIDIHYDEVLSRPEYLDSSLQNRKFIFFPRFMFPWYNTMLQVDALQFLPLEIIRDYSFIFIRGKQFDTPYFGEIESKLKKMSKEKNVQYLIIDYLTQKELMSYYTHTSLTVMTPLTDGTPNSALEAMVAKSPLIIPNLDYDAELFKDTCFILDENSPEKLALLIDEALKYYPAYMLEKAYKNATLFGNRAVEMNKLATTYKN
jgi:hypothetical protein